MLIHITCLHSVSVQCDVANYWPGMHNTTFVIFVESCDFVLSKSLFVRESYQKC